VPKPTDLKEFELERFRVRLLRSNSTRTHDPTLARWLREIASRVMFGEQQALDLKRWLRHHTLDEIHVIFIRRDGWSMAASKEFMWDAQSLWNYEWVAQAPLFKAVTYKQWTDDRFELRERQRRDISDGIAKRRQAQTTTDSDAGSR